MPYDSALKGKASVGVDIGTRASMMLMFHDMDV